LDTATFLGLIAGVGLVFFLILTGEGAEKFVDVRAFSIVIGGTFFAVMAKYSLGQFFGAFAIATTAFGKPSAKPEELIEEMVELATVARRSGMLALEDADISYKFLSRGRQLLVDGTKEEVVSEMLYKERQQILERQNWGARVWHSIGEVLPAMGLIGTLIGLIQMLAVLDDPSAIGPAMSVALMTTLYGTLGANMIALPIADKLTLRRADDSQLMSMCIDGVLGIQAGQNPRILETMLKTYIDPKKLASEEKAKAKAAETESEEEAE